MAELPEMSKYPVNATADLYLQHWDVELDFRDIKTTLGTDILRCQSNKMIEKESIKHFIAYYCSRCLMFKAVRKKRHCG